MSSPSSCSILTISSSISQGKGLAERIIGSNSAANQTTQTGTLNLPWTITNKYYTATVHFSIAETPHVKAEDAVEVPACIFVFSLGESFKNDFTSLMSRFGESDFEVSIAVSVPTPGAGHSTEDELDALETFFGEHGFEYVNGHSGNNLSQEHNIDDMEGIPGIGRLVDALSTILWPSMVQQAGTRRAKARSIVSMPGPPEEEDGLRALLSADTSADMGLKREMAALEKWLEEGADEERDPWEGQAFESAPEAGNSKSQVSTSQETASGFDDNFSDFVSAPAQRAAVLGDTDDDPALPSQEEVLSTSRRIFNTASVDEEDEGDGQTQFDLSRVLGALEAMKEEIAGITDEDEKRKAAAKVALGLVYGLEEG